MDLHALITIVLAVLAWFILIRWVLPWFGVPTCMGGSCCAVAAGCRSTGGFLERFGPKFTNHASMLPGQSGQSQANPHRCFKVEIFRRQLVWSAVGD